MPGGICINEAKPKVNVARNDPPRVVGRVAYRMPSLYCYSLGSRRPDELWKLIPRYTVLTLRRPLHLLSISLSLSLCHCLSIFLLSSLVRLRSSRALPRRASVIISFEIVSRTTCEKIEKEILFGFFFFFRQAAYNFVIIELRVFLRDRGGYSGNVLNKLEKELSIHTLTQKSKEDCTSTSYFRDGNSYDGCQINGGTGDRGN